MKHCKPPLPNLTLLHNLFKSEYRKKSYGIKNNIMKDNIKLDIDITPPSLDDENRKELLWDHREEILLTEWMSNMKESSSAHYKNGKRFKKLYAFVGVPATLIPIIMSGLTIQLEQYPTIQSLLMITTGTLIGISTFFNLGRKFSEHFEYEARYLELALELQKELNKPKKHRIACDVYMEKIYMKYTWLNNSAPVI